MDRTEKIQVRSPKFQLYQSVILYWNGEERSTHIVRRWFDLDDSSDGYWWYKVTNDEQLYPEQAIESHSE
ncbi:hypothetical protein H6G17_09115 [Chroococcidiopsis sp. FACHB-1243]|uniref:hypothetical protein n=1 Tax=Chroococcidiopsis sp. [FACHB-1243] TaxID=2692781 RepID=UPI0017839AC8|nr:hypothetical protein [Chroococcidiopsis sp. [FACHB-1243]]MBD2305675.1 hypothetical protein [Chroococcidiopsis sp. [FACHB-1243]]